MLGNGLAGKLPMKQHHSQCCSEKMAEKVGKHSDRQNSVPLQIIKRGGPGPFTVYQKFKALTQLRTAYAAGTAFQMSVSAEKMIL